MRHLFGMRDPLGMLATAEFNGILKLTKMVVDPKETRDHFKKLLEEAVDEQIKNSEKSLEVYQAKKDDPSSKKAASNARTGQTLGENAEYIENLERAIARIEEVCFEQKDYMPKEFWSPIDDFPLLANPFVSDMNEFVKDVIKSCENIEEKRRNQKQRERIAQISVSSDPANE